MQRRERNEPLEVCDHFGVDQSWAIVIRAAVNNPMADCDRLEILRVLQPPPAVRIAVATSGTFSSG